MIRRNKGRSYYTRLPRLLIRDGMTCNPLEWAISNDSWCFQEAYILRKQQPKTTVLCSLTRRGSSVMVLANLINLILFFVSSIYRVIFIVV